MEAKWKKTIGLHFTPKLAQHNKRSSLTERFNQQERPLERGSQSLGAN